MAFTEHKVNPSEPIHPNHIFIPVIASYSVGGNCVPLYFRYPMEDGTYHDITIARVISQRPNVSFGTIYLCEIFNHDRRMQVYLYFHRVTNKWSLRFA